MHTTVYALMSWQSGRYIHEFACALNYSWRDATPSAQHPNYDRTDERGREKKKNSFEKRARQWRNGRLVDSFIIYLFVSKRVVWE